MTAQKYNKEVISYIRALGPKQELSLLATIDGLMTLETARQLLRIAHDELGLSESERALIRVAGGKSKRPGR